MGNWLALNHDDNPSMIFDKHFTLKCPHCGAQSNLTSVSIPRWQQVTRFQSKDVIIGYRCDSCNTSIALRFDVLFHENSCMFLSQAYKELEITMEWFDYEHLPEAVAKDFREALTCYSHDCYNGTAAMCRRTIQTVAMDLGATGSSRVEKQIVEVKDTSGMDEETFDSLRQIILGGHDGAHPHLPEMTPERAAVLVELMKDVLTQIYVRKARIQAAMNLRQDAIESKKANNSPATR